MTAPLADIRGSSKPSTGARLDTLEKGLAELREAFADEALAMEHKGAAFDKAFALFEQEAEQRAHINETMLAIERRVHTRMDEVGNQHITLISLVQAEQDRNANFAQMLESFEQSMTALQGNFAQLVEQVQRRDKDGRAMDRELADELKSLASAQRSLAEGQQAQTNALSDWAANQARLFDQMLAAAATAHQADEAVSRLERKYPAKYRSLVIAAASGIIGTLIVVVSPVAVVAWHNMDTLAAILAKLKTLSAP